MVAFTDNIDLFKQNFDRMVPIVADEMRSDIEKCIRVNFACSLVDSSAQAVIEYARSNGFSELAAELQKELDFERIYHNA